QEEAGLFRSHPIEMQSGRVAPLSRGRPSESVRAAPAEYAIRSTVQRPVRTNLRGRRSHPEAGDASADQAAPDVRVVRAVRPAALRGLEARPQWRARR